MWAGRTELAGSEPREGEEVSATLEITMQELDEYADLCDVVAMDPDAEPPARYEFLSNKVGLAVKANGGALIGYSNGGPKHMLFDQSFIAKASSGAQIGVNNARR